MSKSMEFMLKNVAYTFGFRKAEYINLSPNRED
jgi:hypothetical protein